MQLFRRAVPTWPWVPWLPVVATVVTAVVLALLNPPMRDLQAALARESANRAGVGVTYWFDWFGGVSPGSYSLIVPTLTSVTGSLPLLCLCTVLIAALAYPVSRTAAHPTLLTWAVSLAAVLNMFSGRVTFSVGVALAMVALCLFQHQRPAGGALLLVVSGLASPLVPAFAGMILVPFLFHRRYRSRTVWTATVGAALGVGLPYLLFGAPGSQPFPWTTLLWSLIIGTGAGAAFLSSTSTPQPTTVTPSRWIAPVAMTAAVVLFIVPTGVGSNLSRFFYLVLPCVVLYWSLKSPRVLALLLSPALVYALFVALYDQVTVADTSDAHELYVPLTDQLDDLVDDGRIDNHRVELVDTGTHAGSFHVTDSVPLARGWENQSDMRYNPVFYEKDALTATSYRDWLSDNAVAYVAVADAPIRQQENEAKLIGGGLDYLSEVWSNDDWRLYRVTAPTPIVAPPLTLLEVSPSTMTVRVPQEAVGTDQLVRIRPSRYLTATSDGDEVDDRTLATCLAPTDTGNWTTARFSRPGVYTLSGQFSVGAALEPTADSCR